MTTSITKTGEKIRALQVELHDLNYRYHSLGETPIPDHEFDAKLRELQVLESDYPQFAYANSPTSRIGGKEVSGQPDFKHARKMLSLDKIFTAQELQAWLLKNQAVVYAEPKIDGLALSLIYEQGQLARAVTRGDGTVGADVTANARAIPGIPLELRECFSGEIRGEVFMSKASFAALNVALVEEGEPPMANPRNAAVGTLKSQDPKVVAQRKLGFFAYGPQEPDVIKRLGFNYPPMFGIMFFQPELSPLESLLEGYRKTIANLPFECDGLVLKIIDMRHRQELGESNTAPKWAVAFKYPPQRVRTKLLDIKLSVGRTGRICPNAVLEPIVVAGTEVSASTLHNADQVRRLGINVGDDIWLQKAGEIIPEIVGRASDLPVNYAGCLDTDDRALAKQAAEDAHAWVMPSHFTDSTGAKHEIIRNEGEVVHKLKNPGACVDCAHAQLKHMTGKTCLDWDGLGAEHCWTLVTSGVRNLFSLMVIDPASTGLKGKVLERFKASRETARSAPLWRVLYALAPEGIGRTYSKQLAALYVNSESVSALDLETLTKLLGPDAGQTLHAELPAIAREFIALKTIGFVLDDAALSGTTGPRPLQGMAFCITGTLSIPREEMAAEIERAGGLCKSSCGKSTTYLLVGDDPGATKVKAAEKHGVKMINEQDLLKLIKA